MLEGLHGEFSRRFQDFKRVENEIHMICFLFTSDMDNAPGDAQLELIDLQADTLWAEHFRSVSLLDIYSSLKEESFSHMGWHDQKILVLFGCTYTSHTGK